MDDETRLALVLKGSSLVERGKGGRLRFKKAPPSEGEALKLHRLIAKHRKIRSAVGTIDRLAGATASDGRVRATFDVTSAVTGRIQVRNPNLQGIDKDPVEGISIRGLLRCDDGNSLVRADFRQFELTLLAQASGCEKLTSFLFDGGDFYAKVAREMFPEADDVASLREVSKQICYLIIYGGQAKALAGVLGVSQEQAQIFLDSFREAFPEIATFEQDLLKEAIELGYVRTLGGRRRYLPELQSRSQFERQAGARKVLATFIQGTAAEIVKDAMLAIEDFASTRDGVQLVLQVHDELVLEAPTSCVDVCADALRSAMDAACRCLGFAVPVRVVAGTALG
jgi:DNA polymerase-1